MEPAHGVAVVHGVESGDLVDSHGRHLQDARDLVHDADAGEAVLSLSEVEEGHDGGLLVLAGVAGQDFLDELLILAVELEGDVEVVVGRVAVLRGVVRGVARRGGGRKEDIPRSMNRSGARQRHGIGAAAVWWRSATHARCCGRPRERVWRPLWWCVSVWSEDVPGTF